MKRHIAYLKYVLRHKWFVFWACRKLRVPTWIAIIHDWDKFLPKMWKSYSECFYMPDGTKQYIESDVFLDAWNDHQKRNRHHYQRYILVMDNGNVMPLPMPDVFVREMVADWRGAGLANGKSNTREWWENTRKQKCIHPATIAAIERYLGFFE